MFKKQHPFVQFCSLPLGMNFQPLLIHFQNNGISDLCHNALAMVQ